jgi:hypothetical protein
MHGAGVNAPELGAVTAITAGLVGELHIPNVLMFVIDTKSLIVARGTAGAGAVATWGDQASTVSTDGQCRTIFEQPSTTKDVHTPLSQIPPSHKQLPGGRWANHPRCPEIPLLRKAGVMSANSSRM